ncbi:MAG TPA: cupin domain-containing protein [Candidatus Saccharimonadales bacterium]|nr:cupin domain-containing protein [Candidatus Saccharimonadales bacterium]
METIDGLMVLGPGEGAVFGPPLDLERKATAGETGGWGVVIVSGMPGEGGRTHRHRGETEAFFILEGQVELLGAETVTPLGPGSFVRVPPDTEHGIRVVGDRPARWLAVWPSALDGYPEAHQALLAEDGPSEAMVELRRRHGIEPGRG